LQKQTFLAIGSKSKSRSLIFLPGTIDK
jgi:hypothetical protein